MNLLHCKTASLYLPSKCTMTHRVTWVLFKELWIFTLTPVGGDASLFCDCPSRCCMYGLMGVWPGGGSTGTAVFPCLSGYLSPAHCLTPALPVLCSPSSAIPLNLTTSPLSFSPSLFVCRFLTLLWLIAFLPSHPLSSVCSRVMVCCGLPTQRNNISGVWKVQPHMSCAAEGRLCEVRPIPHGSYSSQPRDQRPAIPLPSSSSTHHH